MLTLLVTRPDPDAARSAAHLTAMDITAVSLPLLHCVVREAQLPSPEKFAAMVLTSANAVRALKELGAVERFSHLPIYGVGEHTGIQAEQAGFTNIRHIELNLTGLIEYLAHAGIDGPVFYPCGTHLSGDLGKSLEPFGVPVEVCAVYEMLMAEQVPEHIIEAIEGGSIDGALLYSRRTAEAFVFLVGDRLSEDAKKRFALLCLSEKVAEPLIQSRFVRVSLADRPDEDAMMALALSFARERNAS